MVHLIWKDIFIQKRMMLLYSAIIAFYFWMEIPLVGVVFMTSASFIMNAFYFDEKDNINILLNSLPYTRKLIVTSKYIGAIAFTVAVVGLTILGNLIIGGVDMQFTLKNAMQAFGLVLVWQAVIFPFSYKFKQQYLLIGVVVFYVIAISLYNIVTYGFKEQSAKFLHWITSLPELQLYSFSTLILLLLYWGSWRLSICIYERKVF